MYPYQENRDALLDRLRKIEGQVRGVARMIESDRYCVDVLNQIAAIQAALSKVEFALLEKHTRGCVADALQAADQEDGAAQAREKVDELIAVLQHFVR
ncbi:MAG: metal-sensitive transcriptional regulator [Firmicutes bacterium]|nr:metal-sensitive transcriptional regulator [Bacillota bacterium]